MESGRCGHSIDRQTDRTESADRGGIASNRWWIVDAWWVDEPRSMGGWRVNSKWVIVMDLFIENDG